MAASSDITLVIWQCSVVSSRSIVEMTIDVPVSAWLAAPMALWTGDPHDFETKNVLLGLWNVRISRVFWPHLHLAI